MWHVCPENYQAILSVTHLLHTASVLNWHKLKYIIIKQPKSNDYSNNYSVIAHVCVCDWDGDE